MIDWLLTNWVELTGVVASLIYLYFSIKQNVWLWFFGILSVLAYTYIYYSYRLYADMGLQVYYFVISLYGWYAWLRKVPQKEELELKIKKTRAILIRKLSLVSIALYIGLCFVLLYVPEILGIPASDVPFIDAFTTALSIVATWMLARKYMDHWLIWIVVDSVSAVLYLYKGLHLTAGLFVVYTIMAVVGYRTWKKDYLKTIEA